MAKETIKIKKHPNVYCPDCNELIFSASILRHTMDGAPTEQIIYPNCCPICGQRLVPMEIFANEMMFKSIKI